MNFSPETRSLLDQYRIEMIEVLRRNESGPGNRSKLFDLERKLNALGINNEMPEFKKVVDAAHATCSALK